MYDARVAVLVPVSAGELLDKLAILRIKLERITDAAKRANVERELALLEAAWRNSPYAGADVAADREALAEVNARLWDIEDRLRAKERDRVFDAEFIELARSVYRTNDRRAAIKRAVNVKLGSTLREEKSYTEY